MTNGFIYQLTFGTTLGRTRTLRVNHADPAITDAQVRNAMTNFISSSAFLGASGQIAHARRAALIETIVTPINLPF